MNKLSKIKQLAQRIERGGIIENEIQACANLITLYSDECLAEVNGLINDLKEFLDDSNEVLENDSNPVDAA